MKRVALTTAGILATVTALVVVWQLSNILVLFIISLALAAMLRAPNDWLVSRGWPKWLAMVVVYGLGIGVPLALLVGVGWRLLYEADPLLNDLIALYVQSYSSLQNGGEMMQSVAARLPSPTSLTNFITDGQSLSFIDSVVSTASLLGNLAGQLLIAIVVSIYWAADRLRFERVWLSLLAPEQRARARTQWRALESGVGAYLRSELVQSIVAGAILTLVYWLLGFRYPFTLAFLAAVAWLVPLVGGLLALIPVALVGLALGPFLAAVATGFTLLVFLVMEFYVEPQIYTHDRYWRVLVMLVMLAMFDAFGLLGLLVAPPLATAIQLWLNELLTPPPVAVAETSQLDLAEVQAKLESARSLIHDEETPPSPHVANLFERLEGLIVEVEEVAEAQM
jgi:predicted PurR-regulated permease PerM